jgi:hypothetical protein
MFQCVMVLFTQYNFIRYTYMVNMLVKEIKLSLRTEDDISLLKYLKCIYAKYNLIQ